MPIARSVLPITLQLRGSNLRSKVCKARFGSLMLRESRSWIRLASTSLWLVGSAKATPLARASRHVWNSFIFKTRSGRCAQIVGLDEVYGDSYKVSTLAGHRSTFMSTSRDIISELHYEYGLLHICGICSWVHNSAWCLWDHTLFGLILAQRSAFLLRCWIRVTQLIPGISGLFSFEPRWRLDNGWAL